MAQIAKVVAITGDVIVVGLDGKTRTLKVGDVIESNETLTTLAGARVELQMSDGQLLSIAPEQSVRVDDSLTQTAATPTAQEAAVQAATPAAVLQALQFGEDLLAAFEAPAAGLTAGGEGGGGSSFVRLLRIVEGVEPLSYEYTLGPPVTIEEVPLGAVPGGALLTLRYIELDDSGQPLLRNGGLVFLDGADVVEGSRVGLYATVNSPPSGSDLVINLSNGQSITIPVGGGSGLVELTIRPDDPYIQVREVIDIGVTGANGGGYDQLGVDQSTAITVVDDQDLTQVGIVGPKSVREGDLTAPYTVTLEHPGQTDVVVTFQYSGVAQNGVDFTGVASVTIPAGQSSQTFSIQTLVDQLAEGSELYNIRIDSIAGGNFERFEVNPAASNVDTTILDATQLTVNLVGDTTVAEGATASYAVSLAGGTLANDQQLSVQVATGPGTTLVPDATPGVDYNPLTQTLTFTAAVQGPVKLSVVTLADTLVEGSEEYTVNLSNVVGGAIGQGSVTTNITEDNGVIITDLTPKTSGGDVTVNENDLLAARGVGESAGSDSTPESTTQGGSFTITAADGVQTLTIGGLAVITGGVYAGDGTSGNTPLGNTLTITGYNAATGVVSYSYTLNDNEMHANAGGTNSLFEDLTVSLTDRDGDNATDILSVNIVDDVPTAVSDTDSLGANDFTAATGNVITAVGTTSSGADTVGADGAAISGVAAGSSLGTPVTDGTGVASAVQGLYGKLTLGADGGYSYVRDAGTPGGVSDVFTYTLTDGDTDARTATLTIAIGDSTPSDTIPGAGGTDTTVYEAGLPARGSEPEGSGEAAAAGANGDTRETTSGTISFTSPDGLYATDPVTLGGHVLTVTPQTFSDGLTASYAYSAVSGAGTISYSYTLPDNTSGDSTNVSFAVVVKDADGDLAPAGNLVINIVDDVPTITALSLNGKVETDETSQLGKTVTGSESIYKGGVITLGADGGTSDVALRIDSANTGLLTTVGSHAIILKRYADNIVKGDYDSNGDGTLDATAFTVSISNAGVLSVKQDVAIRHPDPQKFDEPVTLADKLSVVISAVDGDGDNDSQALSIGGAISFKDDGPQVNLTAKGIDVPSVIVDETVGVDRYGPGETETAKASNDDDGIDDNGIPFLGRFTTDAAGGLGDLLFNLTEAPSEYGQDGPGSINKVLSFKYKANQTDPEEANYFVKTNLSSSEGGLITIEVGSQVIVGRDANGGKDVFKIEIVNEGTIADPVYQLQTTLYEAIKYTVPPSPSNPALHDETLSLLAASGERSVNLYYQVTRTDADGDTRYNSVPNSLISASSTAIYFQDDGPKVNTFASGQAVDSVGYLWNENENPFGSDGGQSVSITLEGSTYTWNAITDSIAVTAGPDRSVPFDPSDSRLVVNLTTPGQQFAIDMDDGRYDLPFKLTGNFQLNIDYTLVDRDGDQATGNLPIDLKQDQIDLIAGNHVVNGTSGNDVLLGEDGDDTLNSLTGDDLLVGGKGDDLMTGGGGNDTFVWHRDDGKGDYSDTITDFGNGQDKLDLRDLLQGEHSGPSGGIGNLAQFLHFETNPGGDAVIKVTVDPTDLTAGSLSIVLQGVTLPGADDAAKIANLLATNKLVVDY